MKNYINSDKKRDWNAPHHAFFKDTPRMERIIFFGKACFLKKNFALSW